MTVVPALDDGLCAWCRRPRPATALKWCSKKCRQTAWRFRKKGVARSGEDDNPLRLAYADPPYPGCGWRYYRKPDVNHRLLVSYLATYDGWALSTSRDGLREILTLVPKEAIICPFVKTHHQPVARGPGNIHEYVLVVPGRWRQPGPPDAFVGGVPRQDGAYLMGRKSVRFCNWIFQLLGASPCDRLDDVFPGSGVVGRCWEEWCRASTRAVAPAGPTSPGDPKNPRLPDPRDPGETA